MRILVGTLYSGENEFDECVASIKQQTYKEFEHLIIQDRPNREAHNLLFSSFAKQADFFDILIKVDADMVLCSEDLFANLVNKMELNPDLEIFTVAVTDFFSGMLINGLNTYRNTVKWDVMKETLFVDIPEVSPERSYYDQTELAPAAIHCKNPSRFQAFHYGVHRGLKSIARQHSSSHWALLEKTWKNFLLTKDVRIGLAILGAELVYAGKFTQKDVDYTNPRVKDVLNYYKEMNSIEIQREIIRLRGQHWGILPSNIRRCLLRNKYRNWQ